jgi:hypothetical protein
MITAIIIVIIVLYAVSLTLMFQRRGFMGTLLDEKELKKKGFNPIAAKAAGVIFSGIVFLFGIGKLLSLCLGRYGLKGLSAFCEYFWKCVWSKELHKN